MSTRTNRMEMCVLASGSSGNCTVVRSSAGTILIDAGIGPRQVATRLMGTGTAVADISAICVTHLDRDHFNNNWVATIARLSIHIYCHASRADDLRRLARNGGPGSSPASEILRKFDALVTPFQDGFVPLPGVTMRAVALAHDADGSHAFVLHSAPPDGTRIGYATDLGSVPDRLLEAFNDLDMLAIESNYDPVMQRQSGRPFFLQERIMGGRGHLSNHQALKAVQDVFNRCDRRGSASPAHVVLLHRSRQCNCPNLLRELFHRDPRMVGRLTLAEQHARSEWLAPQERQPYAGEQLALNWG